MSFQTSESTYLNANLAFYLLKAKPDTDNKLSYSIFWYHCGNTTPQNTITLSNNNQKQPTNHKIHINYQIFFRSRATGIERRSRYLATVRRAMS